MPVGSAGVIELIGTLTWRATSSSSGSAKSAMLTPNTLRWSNCCPPVTLSATVRSLYFSNNCSGVIPTRCAMLPKNSPTRVA